MKQLTMGAALGGLAVYFFDPDLGGERRDRFMSLSREYRGTAEQARRAASKAAEAAGPMASRMTNAVGRADWAQIWDRGRRPAVSLPKILGAVALGGALVYFLDPHNGSERRRKVLSSVEAGYQAAWQATKPHVDRVGNQVAETIEGVKSKVVVG